MQPDNMQPDNMQPDKISTRKTKIKLKVVEMTSDGASFFKIEGDSLDVNQVFLPDPATNPAGFALTLMTALQGTIEQAMRELTANHPPEQGTVPKQVTVLKQSLISEMAAMPYLAEYADIPVTAEVMQFKVEMLPSLAGMAGDRDAHISDAKRRAHIANATNMIEMARLAAKNNPISLVETDPDVLEVFGTKPVFVSPSPVIVREGGMPVVHAQRQGDGPYNVNSDAEARRGQEPPPPEGMGAGMGGAWMDGDEISYNGGNDMA